MGIFHCPMGATSYENEKCIDCGLCYAKNQSEAVIASKKVREYIKNHASYITDSLKVEKIAICGKGGVGKSTISSLLAFSLKEKGYNVTILDADESNPGLHRKVGFNTQPKPLMDLINRYPWENKELDDEWLKRDKIILDEIPSDYITQKNNLRFMMIGKIDDPLEGCACSMADLTRDIMIKLSLKENEIVIVDQEAGVENFGRGVEKGADTIFIVVEPSYESITLAEKIKYMAEGMGVRRIKAILNKIPSLEVEKKLSRQLYEKEIDILGALYINSEVSAAAFEGKHMDGLEIKKDINKITQLMINDVKIG